MSVSNLVWFAGSDKIMAVSQSGVVCSLASLYQCQIWCAMQSLTKYG